MNSAEFMPRCNCNVGTELSLRCGRSRIWGLGSVHLINKLWLNLQRVFQSLKLSSVNWRTRIYLHLSPAVRYCSCLHSLLFPHDPKLFLQLFKALVYSPPSLERQRKMKTLVLSVVFPISLFAAAGAAQYGQYYRREPEAWSFLDDEYDLSARSWEQDNDVDFLYSRDADADAYAYAEADEDYFFNELEVRGDKMDKSIEEVIKKSRDLQKSLPEVAKKVKNIVKKETPPAEEEGEGDDGKKDKDNDKDKDKDKDPLSSENIKKNSLLYCGVVVAKLKEGSELLVLLKRINKRSKAKDFGNWMNDEWKQLNDQILGFRSAVGSCNAASLDGFSDATNKPFMELGELQRTLMDILKKQKPNLVTKEEEERSTKSF